MRSNTADTPERGQSLAEMAISVTFMLVLFGGILDLGRAYFVYLSLRDAAQEGAAYGSIAPEDIDGIRGRVRDTSSSPVNLAAFSDDQIDIEHSGFACAGYEIKVTVGYDFVMVAPFIAGRTLPLSTSATNTILQPAC